MSNLFFVHTPMQLMVAQQLIHQEKLEHNIMLYGYIENHDNFLKAYDIILIEDMWEKRVFYDNLAGFADLTHRHPIKCFIDSYKKTKQILNFAKQNVVDKIYLGDIDNISYQFASLYFGKHFRIVFFEEGSSHYAYKRKPYKRKFQRFQEFCFDSLYYLPLYNIRFGKYWFREGNVDALKIDERYSIVPGFNNEAFDKPLQVDFQKNSTKVHSYIENKLPILDEDKNCVFLITSPIYEHGNVKIQKERYKVYLDVLRDFVIRQNKDSQIVIKLHPREDDRVCNDIKAIITERNISYCFLSNEDAVPCELYLQILHPSSITMFRNSTSMYNGYLYPKCKIEDLIGRYFDKADKMRVDVSDTKQLYKDIL